MRRLIEVNLLGVMYGSRVAVGLMRPRGRGTIINVGSALSDRAVPLQSAYVASKHGIAGFTEALRLELQHEKTGIDVVLIQPSSINTPLFKWARSKLAVRPQPIPPVYQPSAVAEAIAHAAEEGGREIVVGGAGKLLTVGQWLSPSLVDRYLLQGGRGVRQQMTDAPDDRRDNLFEPSTGPGSATGDFGDGAQPDSVYTRVFELHPARQAAGCRAWPARRGRTRAAPRDVSGADPAPSHGFRRRVAVLGRHGSPGGSGRVDVSASRHGLIHQDARVVSTWRLTPRRPRARTRWEQSARERPLGRRPPRRAERGVLRTVQGFRRTPSSSGSSGASDRGWRNCLTLSNRVAGRGRDPASSRARRRLCRQPPDRPAQPGRRGA